MMKNKLFILLLLSLRPVVAKSNVIDIKFKDLPSLIKSQNTFVKAEKYKLDATMAKKGHLKRSFLPSIGLSVGAETFNNVETGNKTQPFVAVEVKSNIYNAEKDRDKDKIIELDFKNQSLNVDKTINEKLSFARETYLELLFIDAAKQLLRETLKNNDKLKFSTLKRIKRGLVPRSDETKFLLTKLTLESKIQELDLEHKRNSRKLKQLLSLNSKDQLMVESFEEFSFKLEIPFFDNVVDKNITARKLYNELLISKIKKGIYKKSRWPKLDIFAEYNYPTQRDETEIESFSDRNEKVVGLKLTFNLFDGKISSTKELVQSFKEKSLKKGLRGQKEIFGYTYKTLLTKLEYLDIKSKKLQKIKSIHQKFNKQILHDFRLGVKDSGQVQEAHKEILESKLEILETNKEIQFIKVKILKMLGENT